MVMILHFVLQAQATGVAYSHPMTNLTSRMVVFGPNMMFTDLRCSPSCTHAGVHGTVSICPPDCFEYKGTLDVFYKIIWQEGFGRLWRGTNAGLALVTPTVGIYLPCYDIFRNWFEEFAAENAPSMTPYAPLLVGTIDGGAADCQFWHRNLGIKGSGLNYVDSEGGRLKGTNIFFLI
uniref:Uncharacterized protein n=1 Tax=Lactuca sativa TaxID=4236 RepID=A0A9R1XK91_LACSA|nr:hypothetical protein LSAT_V11C300104660 [Lactuca sativa]